VNTRNITLDRRATDRARGMAFGLLALAAGLLCCCSSIFADNSRDQRDIKKSLEVGGDLTVEGELVELGVVDPGDEARPGYALKFEGDAEGTEPWTSGLRMVATQSSHRWLWQTSGIENPDTRMCLDEHGRLVLPGLTGPGLVIDPDGPVLEPLDPDLRATLTLRRIDLAGDGGVVLGAAAPETAGSLRWTGSDFEGFDGERWRSLLIPELDPESDPVFTASAAFALRAQDIERWDAAWIWGNHRAAGYITAAADGDPLTVDGAGHVGIGTSEPQARLHVVGAMVVDGPLLIQPQGDIPMYNPSTGVSQ